MSERRRRNWCAARCILIGAMVGLSMYGVVRTMGAPFEVYSTGFEPPDYEIGFFVAGQGGWLSDAEGGNQVFGGDGLPGQHALVGFSEPEGTNATVSVWRPLNYDAVARGNPVVTFTVTQWITDSSNPSRRDSFRWSVYNTNASPTRLFSLDFDNATTNIAYWLDDGETFVPTPYYYERDGIYTLRITMDFAANRWGAWLEDTEVVRQLPITTRGAALHLGDIDAVWSRADGNTVFGDNYMAFDDYRVVAAPVPAPRLELVELRPDGSVVIAVEGEVGQTIALEASADLGGWSVLGEVTIPAAGRSTYVDGAAAGAELRFYRGQVIP